MTNRTASASDYQQIDVLLAAAFGGCAEVGLVRGLRKDGDMALEMVAQDEGRITGHIAFSPVSGVARGLALAPLSVLPELQRQGIGGALVKQGIKLACEQGWRSVFVLGDPSYYSRFGFQLEKASPFQSPYSGPHFMAMELVEGGLEGENGMLRHAKIFTEIEGDG